MPARVREPVALFLLAIPLLLSFGLAIYAHGRVPTGEVIAVALFAVGPVLVLLGHRSDRYSLLITGLLVYVLYIVFWYLSWGGLHFLIGVPALLLGLLVGRWNRADGQRLHQEGEP